jgi:thiosulfate/3-mercaptopyruvate sulfurtransferase
MRILAVALISLLTAAWAADPALIQPKDLAAQLEAGGKRPILIHVGFDVLYRSRHITGSIYAGPGNRPEGLEKLRAEVNKLPRNSEIVIYCGCCPWDHCPNVRPASELLRQMGFTKLKVLLIPTNMKVDWYDHGYPSER